MTSGPQVPNLDSPASVLEAALAYAEGGWFVLPVDRGVKHAGSVLGRGWPEKSSRDAACLRSWFRTSEYGLALHVGRSGCLAVDVDDPSAVPAELAEQLLRHTGPYQSTRRNVHGRGHFLYLQPRGRMHGNGRGRLQGAWGDVRGRNGILIVQPTQHSNPEGRYVWIRTGPVPALPSEIEAALSAAPGPRRSTTPPGSALRPSTTADRGPSPRTLATSVRSIRLAEQRNNAVFESACRMGELVARGLLSRPRAIRTLLEAGRAVGLSDVELVGYDGDSGTIGSGLRTGAAALRRHR